MGKAIVPRSLSQQAKRAHVTRSEVLGKMFGGIRLTNTDRRRLAQATRTLDRLDSIIYGPALRRMDAELRKLESLERSIRQTCKEYGIKI